MNRSDVIEYVAQDNNITKKRAEEIVIMILDLMKEAVVNGEKVQITGFGTFEVRERQPRTGRNPRTNEEVKIEAYRKPIFRPSNRLKEIVNSSEDI